MANGYSSNDFWIDNKTNQINGYNCPNCGGHIPNGYFHQCPVGAGGVSPYIAPPPPPSLPPNFTPIITIDPRIVLALEMIAAQLKRLVDDWLPPEE